MPAMVHLTRLGYQYFGKISEDLAGDVYDPDTNILIQVFEKQFNKLNPSASASFIDVFRSIKRELTYDDLGKSFYRRLVSTSPVRLIDFDAVEENIFHFTAEFTCKNGQDEFRPDITLFINGLPLVLIEVKKPHNVGGIVSEMDRMIRQRFPNEKFRRFINLTQLMIFSNNMEYDSEGGISPIQGAFYCTSARSKTAFSTFREENLDGAPIAPFNASFDYFELDVEVEKKILSDFNVQVIRNSLEYSTNTNLNSPTNRIITSMCSPERLLFILQYGIAYVRVDREIDGKISSVDEKHIMRYQQLFASLILQKKIGEGSKSGVIWHTQGSGKTALTFYLTKILTNFFSNKGKVAKFYFIVDRLDLLEQATQEFEARGLEVKTANSRAELMKQFRNQQSLEGDSGKAEITVVNIQRFAEDNSRIELNDYSTSLQRVFIVDEAHRGYNPAGSFLANLLEADKNSIKLALTGTPLLSAERASWKIFGEYLHTYYYDKSIQDGYTLKIMREDIETSYRERLSEIYDSVENLIQRKDIKKSQIIEHEKYVKELLRFIISDFTLFRKIQNDDSLGAMIICESSEQARKLKQYFNEIQNELRSKENLGPILTAGLVLFDSDDKETRKQIIKDFKKNSSIDILIVFNMLLTGFDAGRLKRLYMGRKLKDHNLLQALTRVNRPYHDMQFGFVVDFADVKENFESTNKAYMQELIRFNDQGDMGLFTGDGPTFRILEDPQFLLSEMRNAKQKLFNFNIDNLEEFATDLSSVYDKKDLLDLKKALITIRDAHNLVRSFGDENLKEYMAKIKLEKLPELLSEVQNAILIFNQKEAFYSSDESTRLINLAMLEIEFSFRLKLSEEMKIKLGSEVDLQNMWAKTISCFATNIDQEDPSYVSIREEFMKHFKNRGFVISSTLDLQSHSSALEAAYKKLLELKKINEVLLKKYKGDPKFVRIHKRIIEENATRVNGKESLLISQYHEDILKFLETIKFEIDNKVYDRNDILKKDSYFEQTVMQQIASKMNVLGYQPNHEDRVFLQNKIAREYLEQYNEIYSSK